MNTTWVVGWSLLHFLWQGAAVATLLAIALATSRHRSARHRYGLAVGALAVMALLPVATATYLTRQAARGETDVALAPTGKLTRLDRGGVAAATNAQETLTASSPSRLSSSRPIDDDASATLGAASDQRGVTALLDSVRRWGDASAPLLVIGWLAGVLLLSVRFVGGWLRVGRLTREGTRPASVELTERLAELADRLALARPVRLVESALVQVPAVVGWLRPVLLVPLTFETGLTVQELELLLAHELAHVRRHDYLVNILQTIVETVLFYHPAVWWVSGRIREEREHCCDDVAVALCRDRRAYAEALLRLEHMRQDVPALAVAATGGSLLKRIRRLVVAPPHHSESRSRWAAVPLGLTAAIAMVFAARAASADATTRITTDGARFEEFASADTLQRRDARGARPDTVLRYSGSAASLGDRWTWATSSARQDRRAAFWIGYVIAGDPARGWLYVDRNVPVYFEHGMMTGRMRFTETPRSMSFSGVKLDALVGDRPPEDVAVLYGFVSRNGRVQLDRVHVASFALPAHFSGRSLYWLGEAGDAESIAQAARLFDQSETQESKKDLVSVVGAHLDAAAVLPVLRRWLESNEPSDIRSDVAEELSFVGTPAALALAARTARADRSRDVRREAAEALGDFRLAEATDTLIEVARDLDDAEVRREAIEALGSRPEPRALDALVRFAREDRSEDVQREAVESMGESKDPRAIDEIMRIARAHANVEVRREAVETLGEAEEPAKAVAVLRELAERDPNGDVRLEAIETLGEVKDESAFRVLETFARSHSDADARRKAVEALAKNGEKETVFKVLSDLVHEGGNAAAQKSAVEALGDLEDERAVKLLEDAATGAASADVQRAAAEALGGATPAERAWEALDRIVWKHDDESVQRAAIEAMHDVERAGKADAFARIAADHPRREVRRAAVEALGSLEHDAAAARHLAQLAREGGDEELRAAAIETYDDVAPVAEVVTLLSTIARSDRSADMQRKALESLADLDDNAGLEAIIQIARTHPNADIRRAAIEHLGDSEDPRAHAELARLLKR